MLGADPWITIVLFKTPDGPPEPLNYLAGLVQFGSWSSGL